LEKEKAEVHTDLRQKFAQIEELHKEIQEKSKMIAEKEEQCNALLIQLNKSRFFNSQNVFSPQK
jgi:peptidoglycan hydrolase CwlO-like protein